MLQCTAVTSVTSSRGEVGYPLCELGAGHEGEHAQYCWDEDAVGGAVWFRWGAREGRFAVLPWCEAAGGEYGDACMLFADHPAGHSWDVTDPTLEAVREDLERRFPELLRQPRPRPHQD